MKSLLLCSVVACQLLSLGDITTNNVTLSQSLIPNVTEKLDPSINFAHTKNGKLENIASIIAKHDSLDFSNNNNVIASFTNDGSLKLNKLEVTELLVSQQLLVNGVKQWRLILRNDFNDESSLEGWDISDLEPRSQCAGVTMLGGYKKFAVGEVTKTFKIPEDHEYLKIKFNFHFIDEWQGQTAFLRANIGDDGSLVHIWTQSYEPERTQGINLCGSDFPEYRFSQPVSVSFPHTDKSIVLGIGTNITINVPESLSWGISNLEIYAL